MEIYIAAHSLIMIILTGTYPPERCGVGDYVHHLLGTKAGSDWSLLYLKNWRWRDLRANIAQLCLNTDQILNLQYPTMGYGTSLVPHIMAIYAVLFLHKKLYITVHEYSQLGWKGKWALQLLFLFATNVIFTTSFECALAHKHGLSSRKGAVIKINSNIPVSAHIKPALDRQWDLGYFGYIRPLKGLEEFVLVAKDLKAMGRKAYIMGQTQPEYRDFYEPFLREIKQKGIRYIDNLPSEEVANILADTKIMYLPFPDGLSERRGSFLAAAVNGAVVVSKEGKFTTEEQKQHFLLPQSSEVVGLIEDELSNSKWLEQQQQQCLAYVASSVPSSWEQVAEEYSRIIQ